MKLHSCPNLTDNKEYEEIVERGSLGTESSQHFRKNYQWMVETKKACFRQNECDCITKQ